MTLTRRRIGSAGQHQEPPTAQEKPKSLKHTATRGLWVGRRDASQRVILMTDANASPALRYVRRVVGGPRAEFTDAQLLGSVVSGRDEGAFEVLLGRHGPKVLGICRRVLRHEQDAEDA